MKYAVGIEGNSMSGYEYALYMKAYMHMANSWDYVNTLQDHSENPPQLSL